MSSYPRNIIFQGKDCQAHLVEAVKGVWAAKLYYRNEIFACSCYFSHPCTVPPDLDSGWWLTTAREPARWSHHERRNDHGSDARRPSRDLKAPHSRPSRWGVNNILPGVSTGKNESASTPDAMISPSAAATNWDPAETYISTMQLTTYNLKITIYSLQPLTIGKH